MPNIFEFLSSPAGLVIAALAFASTLAALCSITIIAIREGRSINFWPPSIGLATDTDKPISGRRLLEHKGQYPVDLEHGTNRPYLNQSKYVSAMHYLLHETTDRIAAMDLVYLREDNRTALGDILKAENETTYNDLIKKYKLDHFRNNYHRETEVLLRNFKAIVQDLGGTLRHVHFEALLHDVRNPLRSIIAAINTDEVSGRKINDPSTRFVVHYVKHQGKNLLKGGSSVAYRKRFDAERTLKATTTPIFDQKYGLIAIMCFNIDIDAITTLSPKEKDRFCMAFVETSGDTPAYELESPPTNPE